MDDDNVAKPYEISRFIQVALKTGADILTCFADVIRGHELLRPDRPSDSRWLYMGDALAVGAFYNCFGDTNAMVRRDCLLGLGGFTEDYGYGHEDKELYARAVLEGHRLEVVPEALYWYRENPSGINLNSSDYLNSMRGLRPYRDALPDSLHHVLSYAHSHYWRSIRNPVHSIGGTPPVPVEWPLRYRLADRLNHFMKGISPIHRLVRSSLLTASAFRRRGKVPSIRLGTTVLRYLRRPLRRPGSAIAATKTPHSLHRALSATGSENRHGS